MSKLIGLHGKAGSGKDTAFHLLKESDPGIVRDAFADRLKLSAIRSFLPHCDIDQAYAVCEILKNGGRVKLFLEKTGESGQEVTGREFLQHYGTEAHRDVFADDFWVNAVLPNTSNRLTFGREDYDEWTTLIITDVRFPNEAEAIRKAGGKIWHILRPELETDNPDQHLSEKPLDAEYIDAVIVNDGSLEDFKERLQVAHG